MERVFRFCWPLVRRWEWVFWISLTPGSVRRVGVLWTGNRRLCIPIYPNKEPGKPHCRIKEPHNTRTGQKWWLTILETEISGSQWEGSACTHERSSFFFLRGEGFSKKFPYSHQVPKGFSSSQRVPKCIRPKMFSIASGFYDPIWFAQSSTYMNINWKGKSLGEHICFYFATRVQSKETKKFNKNRSHGNHHTVQRGCFY
jgi:hypothetical protein